MVDRKRYSGREQAYVKHTFLEGYLDGLLFKVAFSHDVLTYVDGYAGPWQSKDENYSDTSFGLALAKLRQVKATLATQGRTVRVRAVLVEERTDAFAELEKLQERYPDIEIVPLRGRFLDQLDRIEREIGKGFAFVFIDPKGFSVEMNRLGAFIARPNREVVFNFMFDFANRFTGLEALEPVYEQLFVGINWRERLENASDRKQVMIDCVREVLSAQGNYPYCVATDVLKTDSNRVLYALVYATRHPKGLEVFRDTQIKALRAQSRVRAGLQLDRRQSKTSQGEMFSLHEMSADGTETFLTEQRKLAKQALLAELPGAPEWVRFGDVASKILERFVVRATDVRQMGGALRKAGLVEFDQWPAKKQVPDLNFRMRRVGLL